MSTTVEIWFPNYKYNPGIISKELLSQIRQLTKHFDVEIIEGTYLNYEKFVVTVEFNNKEYQDYITTLIHKNLGSFTQPDIISPEETVLGRVFSPGKVGFGIFVDIGIRSTTEQTDALLPLYQLREDLEMPDASTREIVNYLGLVDGYPLPVSVEEVQLGDRPKIDLSLDNTFLERIDKWSEIKNERLIFTKCLKSKIRSQVKDLKLQKYVDTITMIDPLTTVLTCSESTNASGLVPKLGARLPKIPIGIFQP